MKVKGLDIVWLLLLAATAFTWWLGHSGALVPPRLAMMALACRVMAPRSMKPKRRGSWPMKRLSATDMFGSRLTS